MVQVGKELPMRDVDYDSKEWWKMLYYVWFVVQNIEVND
jgi:hypothetical protein